MSQKILITVGGTGGHIFPAISLGKQLIQADASLDILFAGGNLSANPYFEREVFPYRSFACATFKKKNPWEILKTTTKIVYGIGQSCQILKEFKPDLVVGFGSYYTFPLLIAAKLEKIPYILHEANSVPGKVNRLLAKSASVVGIHFPETASLLKGNTYEVGLPLRPGYHKGSSTPQQAREYFDLDAKRFTFLIFGGSQGAANLNNLISKTFTSQLNHCKESFQIIHLVGEATTAQFLHKEYQKSGVKACVKAFESRMDLAWQAADLAITRAGAGTIAEQMEFEVPGLLIPYPYATDNHQDKNADFLVKTIGGAIKFAEADITPALLAQEIGTFSDEKWKKMSHAIRDYKSKYRTKSLCNLITGELDRCVWLKKKNEKNEKTG